MSMSAANCWASASPRQPTLIRVRVCVCVCVCARAPANLELNSESGTRTPNPEPRTPKRDAGVKVKAYGMFNYRLKWRCRYPDMNLDYLLRIGLWDENLLTAHQVCRLGSNQIRSLEITPSRTPNPDPLPLPPASCPLTRCTLHTNAPRRLGRAYYPSEASLRIASSETKARPLRMRWNTSSSTPAIWVSM